MGNPQHFSQELPGRCMRLIDELWPYAAKIKQPGQEHLGPLTTTFLLAMATPIINLPYERIKQHIGLDEEAYADDRKLNPRLVEQLKKFLESRPFSESPFFLDGAWSFAQRDPVDQFNVAQKFPSDLSNELGSIGAFNAAKSMHANQWISCLRNSLAHGGIAYLNSKGHQTFGEPVKMYAFVNATYDENRELKKMNILRISDDNFREFLRRWVSWLQDTGLAHELAA